jgi:hypothetical protein
MNNTNEHEQSTGAAASRGRGTFTAFGARHATGVAISRWIAAVGFATAGALLLAFGQWWGAVFFLATVLNVLLAYRRYE